MKYEVRPCVCVVVGMRCVWRTSFDGPQVRCLLREYRDVGDKDMRLAREIVTATTRGTAVRTALMYD